MKNPISVIILTFNEELNIEKCLESITDWANEIIIVDSFSKDKTPEIAKKYTNKIAHRTFVNQAEQFNWALDNLEIKNDWILRLDADEYLTEELKEEITQTLINADKGLIDADNIGIDQFTPLDKLPNGASQRKSEAINGFFIKRRFYFMGRWIKHGGYQSVWLLRLFKKDKAKSELREIDEHIVLLEGKTENLKNDFIHDDKKSLQLWIDRHNQFSSREAKEILNFLSLARGEERSSRLTGQPARNRWLKEKIYYRMPLFYRAFFYFIYRYFFCLGFLDGKEGLIYHFLRIYWYRFLLDSKIYEYKKKSVKNQ